MDLTFGTAEVPPPLYRAILVVSCIEKVMYDNIELLSILQSDDTCLCQRRQSKKRGNPFRSTKEGWWARQPNQPIEERGLYPAYPLLYVRYIT